MVQWEFWSTGNKSHKAFFLKSPPPLSGSFFFLSPLLVLSRDISTPTSLFMNLVLFIARSHVLLRSSNPYGEHLSLCSVVASRSTHVTGEREEISFCLPAYSRFLSFFLGIWPSCRLFTVRLIASSILVTPAVTNLFIYKPVYLSSSNFLITNANMFFVCFCSKSFLVTPLSTGCGCVELQIPELIMSQSAHRCPPPLRVWSCLWHHYKYFKSMCQCN